MKVIVTGSEGFIGKVLCATLKKRGVDVVEIDRKTGRDAKNIGQYLKSCDIDCVFHLAAQTSVFNDDIQQIKYDNIDVFISVVGACNEYGVKLVYASSSTANRCNTTSMYGISKYFDEQYASVYANNATGVRLHNVYGPNPRQGTLLWYLMNKDKVSLSRGGQNIRCFTFIRDAVEGLIYAHGINNKLVNLVNNEPMTIYEFAKIVKRYHSFEIEVVSDYHKFDNLEQKVDTSLFTLPLPYTSVADGIKSIFTGHKE